MTSAQEGKYWRAWSDTLKALRKLGHTGTADELRHFVHEQAIGRDKGHKTFNNLDFDAYLRVCAGYVRMGDLDEQLRLQAMPLTRALIVAEPYLDAIGVETHGRVGYVRAIYTRIQAKRPQLGAQVFELEEIPDADLVLVISALLHTAQHKKGVGHLHSRTGKGRVRYDHDVGARQRARGQETVAPLDQDLERAEPTDSALSTGLSADDGLALVSTPNPDPLYRGPAYEEDPF